ncbi:MAG: GH116 family glycosyl hydrolase [Chloroflexota bacterium]
MIDKAVPFSDLELFTAGTQRTFRGRRLLQIAMPIGGIGAGCVNFNGQGGLQDFSIRNTPSISAMPDAHHSLDCGFAAIHLPASGVSRILEGPIPVERIYNQGLKGQGYQAGGYEGLPRFRNCTFKGEYPFGKVGLQDDRVPLKVSITSFNPFIPLDDKNSSLPCVALEYTFQNTSRETVAFEFSYHLSHLAYDHINADFSKTRNAVIPGTGAYLYNTEDENSSLFGSCALGVVGFSPEIKAMWFRGGWFDGISALWREISTGSFTPNAGAQLGMEKGRNGASILLKAELKPNEKITFPILITWHFPNVHYAFGEENTDSLLDVASFAQHGSPGCGPGCDCNSSKPARWHPYYASHWKNAQDVLDYMQANYSSLRARTTAFHNALFASSLPGYVLDAVSANLAIIKSSTVLRQANGNLWGWEGCFCDHGCCHGSCTHVWNYAQAIPNLFPALERTLREQELSRSMDARGHVSFRAALPDGATTNDFHPAADGQLGGVMKVFREWQISGDREWLAKMYPLAKKSMDFCIQCWDPDRLGVLMEPHHNTYDIEFWGPDGMCTSFYIGALGAMARLAEDAGHPEDIVEYIELARKGAEYLDNQLYNGEYYEQKGTLSGLRASPSEAALQVLREKNPAEYELLMREGPKYQYGKGCISDGVFGAWLAHLCGIHTVQNQVNIRRNLRSIFEYNFKNTLWEHSNPQRPGFAIGDEPGLLLCSWPKGEKPTLPFVYSDEVWTGIEYQAAAHMISEGLVREGLTIVKALRSRYDGLARNPWNEYECGNYYARAMASYGLLFALSGFFYSASEKKIVLEPRLEVIPFGKPFKTFFSTATGWGILTIKDSRLMIDLKEGFLEVDKLMITLNGKTITVDANFVAVAGRKAEIEY